MLFLRIAFVVVLAIAGSSLRAAEPTTESLVEQLGSKSFAERERASKTLKERGPVVLPALRKAMATKDEEVRKRLESLIPLLEIAEALLPTRVSIQLDNHPLTDAIKQLQKQTACRFAWLPLVPRGAEKWKIELKDTPFWEALNRLSTDKERIVCVGDSRRDYDRDRRPSAIYSIQGPFRLDLTGVHEDRDVDFTRAGKAGVRDRKLTLSIGVQSEPRITFLKVDPAKILEAVDSDGKSLLESKAATADPTLSTTSFIRPSERGTFRAESLNFSDVRLQRAGDTAKSIKLLRGTIPVKAIVLRKSVLAAADILKVNERRVPGTGSTVIRSAALLNGIDVQIEMRSSEEEANAFNFSERFKLKDDSGKDFLLATIREIAGDGGRSITLRFEPQNKTGAPAALYFEQWISHEFEIPFEFRDIPMP